MQKFLLPIITFVLSLFVLGCNNDLNVQYSVVGDIPGGNWGMKNGELSYDGPLINWSYVDENGENQFEDLEPQMQGGYSGDFKAGDTARIQAQSSATSGTITVSIKVEGDKVAEETIDLSVRKIVEASVTVE